MSEVELEVSVLPSLPAKTLEEHRALADALTGVAEEFQIDLVDGRFVSATSWPFSEAEEEWLPLLLEFAVTAEQFQVEFDCMILEPERYLDTFADIGARRVIVHLGSTDRVMDCIAHGRAHGYELGLALTNDVPLGELMPYLSHINFVQLMGIAEVGAQGQPFDVRTVPRAEALRAEYPELTIAVDGSVNEDTTPILNAAGVNRFAPGSAIAKAEDPAEVYRELLALARH